MQKQNLLWLFVTSKDRKATTIEAAVAEVAANTLMVARVAAIYASAPVVVLKNKQIT